MSTRTDWGWFKADGTPIAVGDDWHSWLCPRHHYEPSGHECFMSGEWVDDGNVRVMECRSKSTGPKRDVCEVCGNVFIYP